MNGKWGKTPFRFKDFSSANSAMKSMVGQYQALLVRDESGNTFNDNRATEDFSDLTIGE